MACMALQDDRVLNVRPIRNRIGQLIITFRGVVAYQARQFRFEHVAKCRLLIEWLFIFLGIKILND